MSSTGIDVLNLPNDLPGTDMKDGIDVVPNMNVRYRHESRYPYPTELTGIDVELTTYRYQY